MDGNGTEGESVVSLLRQLLDQLSTLMRQELALAGAEMSRSLATMKAGVASAAIGGAVVFLGIMALLACATLALTLVLAPWLATLIVGVVVTGTGGGMLLAGQSRLKSAELKPKRSEQSLRRDKDAISRSVS
jgi:hypothetical protein